MTDVRRSLTGLLVSGALVGSAWACSAPSGANVHGSDPVEVAPTHASLAPDGSATTGFPEPSASPEATFPAQSYWDRLAIGANSGAQTIGEAAEMAELVVIGRWIESVRDKGYGAPGEIVGWYATATIEVEEVLGGGADVEIGDEIQVPFLVGFGVLGSTFPDAQLIALETNRPTEAAVLFLRSWSTFWDRTETDVPDWLADLDRPDRFHLIGTDGALPLVDDAVSDVVYEIDMPAWRIEMAGRDRADVSAMILSTSPTEPSPAP